MRKHEDIFIRIRLLIMTATAESTRLASTNVSSKKQLQTAAILSDAFNLSKQHNGKIYGRITPTNNN